MPGRCETVPALVARAVEEHAGEPAVVDGEVALTYRQLADRSREFAASLVASGIEVGDRVAVWAPNGHRWIVAALGLWHAGAVLIPVNTRFKGTEAAEILERARARVLVTVTDFLGEDRLAMLRSTGSRLCDLATVVVADGPVGDGSVSWQDFVDAHDAPDLEEADRRAREARGDDACDILFTSGTTGRPKGVVSTHFRTTTVGGDWVAMTGLRSGDRYLMVNPYFHMFGLKAGILASITAGATMLPEAVFEAGRVLERVESERITVLPGAPTVYQSLLDHPDRTHRDLSSLRIAVTGAADIPVELIGRVLDELPFPTVLTGYGLTEAGTASATKPGDSPEVIATTVGRARPGFEIRIVATGDAAADAGDAGVIGEVWVRGPSVMSHYLDDPEATAAAIDGEGWLRTGDLGVIDDAGNLRIAGRLKDMFIVGGFNAYPAEIENLLLGHPDVSRAAVIGVPDARLGEVGMAFVVARPGSTTTGPDLLVWAREHMANYKAPRRVEVVDDLPLNATGKVDKLALRDLASGGPS